MYIQKLLTCMFLKMKITSEKRESEAKQSVKEEKE